MHDETTIIPVTVSCYAGYRGEETPRRFKIREREIIILEVQDRWLAPNHRYFKVIGDDNGLYILRHDQYKGTWEMTFFKATAVSFPDQNNSVTR